MTDPAPAPDPDPASTPAPDPLTPPVALQAAERARVMLAVWHGLGHGAGLSREEVGALWELAAAAIEAAERSAAEGERAACAAALCEGCCAGVPYLADVGAHDWPDAVRGCDAVAIRARGA